MKPDRIMLFLLTAALLSVLSSCGAQTENAPEIPSPPAAAEQTEKETEPPLDPGDPSPIPEENSETEKAEPETEAGADPQVAEEASEQIEEPVPPVELYQLAPENQSLMMSYVILTPNKKVVVIDGGTDGYEKIRRPIFRARSGPFSGSGRKTTLKWKHGFSPTCTTTTTMSSRKC